MTEDLDYDVVIIGAGICGTALLHILCEYTNAGRLAILEKCDDVGRVNTARRSNSQTLHEGDIETNYDLERSKEVKQGAAMVRRYLEAHDPQGHVHTRTSKMALAVGAQEIERLQRRFDDYSAVYPDLRLLDRSGIAEVEPAVVRGRDPDEPLLALQSDEGLAVDFGLLARSFFDRAVERRPDVEGHFRRRVTRIRPVRQGYEVQAGELVMRARTVVVAAGAHSLMLARQLGLGQELSLLSVYGGFFLSEAILRGKVYTLQQEGLPFAAVHGDAEVHEPSLTRFGPTAMPLPMLERGRPGTIVDYLRAAGVSPRALKAFLRVVATPPTLGFAVRNVIYALPWLGRRAFARQARKIVPELDPARLRRARGWGGIRPQVLDLRRSDLDLGEQKLFHDRAIFAVTPSPGASMCLASAADDARRLVEWLGAGYRLDEARLQADLLAGGPLQSPSGRDPSRSVAATGSGW